MPAPHHSVFYRPDALPAAQPTESKHWRQYKIKINQNWETNVSRWSNIAKQHISQIYQQQKSDNIECELISCPQLQQVTDKTWILSHKCIRPVQQHCRNHLQLYIQTDAYTEVDSDVISVPAGFRRHLVGKTLINVFHCDIAEICFVGKLVIIQTFHKWTDGILFE